jgi:acyl carrier protein
MTILETLGDLFRMVFDDDTLRIAPETTADDVDGWDSLSHVNLVLAIESRFGIRFAQKELLTQRNVGDLVAGIASKLPG